MGGWVYSSPAVVNGIVYAGNSYESLYDLKGVNGSLYAIDAVTGTNKWRFTTEVSNSPVIENGILFVVMSGSLLAIGQASLTVASATGVPTTGNNSSTGTPNPIIP